MKPIRNKKWFMAASFCIGALLLGTTAFADITASTGYDQLKQSIKSTTASLDGKLQSYTTQLEMSLKDNGKLLTAESSANKVNTAEKKTEQVSSTEYANGEKTEYFSYRDSKTSINKYSGDDVYNVMEFSSDTDFKPFSDPFQEDRASDMEKIFDAVVGNLSNYVMAEENEDGSQVFTGSLGESQIPALVNAVSSFFVKQEALQNGAGSDRVQLPQIASDVFIKKVSGKAVVNKDDILESVLATCILSGKDEQGNTHDLTLEVLLKISDINTTSVEKPDLTGKKVETYNEKVGKGNTISTKYIGKYKNDIVTEKDGQYIKLGERHLEITGIDEKHITGRYYETYKPEYAAEYDKTKVEFMLDAEIADGYRALFSYQSNGYDLSELYLSDGGGKVSIGLGGRAPQNFDYQFVRDFE